MTECKIDTPTVSVLNPLMLTPSEGRLRLKCQPNTIFFPFATVGKVQLADKASNVAPCAEEIFFVALFICVKLNCAGQ